jgi:phage replication O-like protein O
VANPQKEDGYTAIANEIMSKLARVYIPNGPMRIILQVLRETWGYNRKWVQISHSELAKRTAMHRQHATRYLDQLFEHNVLRSAHAQVANDDVKVVTKDKRVKPIGFVKDHDSWKPFVRRIGTRSGGNLKEIGTRSGGKHSEEIGTCSGGKVATCSGADLKNPPIILKERKTISPPIVPPKGDGGGSLRTILSAVQLERFNRFWSVYPKKRSKGQAEKAWKKIKPSEQLAAQIVEAVERAKTSYDWTKAGGKYIPYPATWLNAKGWEDEIDESRNGSGKEAHPATYAQCQDAERRAMARALLENDDDDHDWHDSQGADGA